MAFIRIVSGPRTRTCLALVGLFFPLFVRGQAVKRSREFPPGAIAHLADLPPSRLRTRLEGLPLPAQQRALGLLRSFHFTELDLNSLDADADGGVFYEDHFPGIVAAQGDLASPDEPVVAAAAVPVSPFPRALYLHSNPGAGAVLFLNFSGETVTGTSWNSSVGRSEIVAVPFSLDSDYSTFSDAEQLAIRHIWQRVAEDFSPFNIDVTTERPATFGSRTAHALITRSTDAGNNANPSSSAGGIAYVDVFGRSSYSGLRPAWIYSNNLGDNESTIAEAVSHEIGHNLGLSHDGLTDGTEYYQGHGTGPTSWGPIMGAAYYRDVTQWSKGDYYRANNTQDDLAIISAKIPYRNDEPNDAGNARTLVITGGTNVISTTLENDPSSTNSSNKGILQQNNDSDVFTFATGDGPVRLTVNPWTMTDDSRGGNLDIALELRDSSGTLLATNNSASETAAVVQMNLRQGTYYLHIRNSAAGNPLSSSPSGYTSYGGIGEYFISGYVAPQTAAAARVQLTATANNPAWGSITPPSGTYSVGAAVQLLATPSPWYRFVGWTNGTSGTSNPVNLLLTTNLAVVANFAELMTSLHPTPYWWLAGYGYTNNLDAAAESIGRNGMPVWQSYLAGLNPNDPGSQLRLTITKTLNGEANVLSWSPVSGRVYTIRSATNFTNAFVPLTGASNLPPTVNSFTNVIAPTTRASFYRLEVRKL